MSSDLLPVIVILGRPNVGKSSLFNRLIGRRQALVDSTPGLTRDRLYGDVIWRGKRFRLADTGGLIFSERDRIQEAIASQVLKALEEASLALLLCDARDGLVPLDREVASWLRPWGKPVLLTINKVDSHREQADMQEFSELGFGVPLGVSVLHGLGMGELLDEVVKHLPLSPPSPLREEGKGEGLPDPLAVAILGRPNVGKSSMINQILNEERVLVSPESGTTRDPVEIPFSFNGRRFVLVDTAGIRSKRTLKERIDAVARIKALETMTRAHVCVGILDATTGFIRDDLKLLDQIREAGKPLCLVVNKWDLVPPKTDPEEAAREVQRRAPFLSFAPVLPASAKTGRGVLRILEEVVRVAEGSFKRLGSRDCERFLKGIKTYPKAPAGLRHGHLFRLIQVGVAPPTFHLLGRVGRGGLKLSEASFLEKSLRKLAGFHGTPIRIRLLSQGRKK